MNDSIINAQSLNTGKVDVSIVLAIYNEEICISEELTRIKAAMDKSGYSYEIIAVNDASTDKSLEILKRFPFVKIINHKINMGSGSARKTGTLAAIGNIVVWTDVDMTYPNDLIPALVTYLIANDYDQVVGSRRQERGTIPVLRVPAKWFIRKLAIYLSEADIPDLNSGLRAFKREIGNKYLYLLPKGFSCVTTMTLSFLTNGKSVGYFPIEYNKRAGKSKFHPIKDTYKYLLQVIRMITYYNPLKIFIPLSFLIVLVGVLTSIYDRMFRAGRHSLEESDIIIVIAGLICGVVGLLADLIVTQNKRFQ